MDRVIGPEIEISWLTWGRPIDPGQNFYQEFGHQLRAALI